MLKQSLNIHEIDFNQKFPIFWFESTQCWGYVTEPKHLVYIQYMNNSNVLNTKCTKAFDVSGKNPSFGTYSEYRGKLTLREFLKNKEVDISNLNLFT